MEEKNETAGCAHKVCSEFLYRGKTKRASQPRQCGPHWTPCLRPCKGVDRLQSRTKLNPRAHVQIGESISRTTRREFRVKILCRELCGRLCARIFSVSRRIFRVSRQSEKFLFGQSRKFRFDRPWRKAKRSCGCQARIGIG